MHFDTSVTEVACHFADYINRFVFRGERFPLLPFYAQIARSHAQVWAELAARGQPIGPHDLWLAASCLAHGLVVACAGVRVFGQVPGSQVEEWRVRA